MTKILKCASLSIFRIFFLNSGKESSHGLQTQIISHKELGIVYLWDDDWSSHVWLVGKFIVWCGWLAHCFKSKMQNIHARQLNNGRYLLASQEVNFQLGSNPSCSPLAVVSWNVTSECWLTRKLPQRGCDVEQ